MTNAVGDGDVTERTRTTAEHLHTAADICSNGGGRQTTAMLVLTVKGWKVGEVEKWLAKRGYSEDNPATVAIGFSKDEYKRAKGDRAGSIQRRVYPLLHMEWKGGTGLDVAQCEQLIREAGLPVPPKSSCYFCPFHKPIVWREMARDRPELFEDSCRMEETMLAKRLAEGKKPAYFSRFGRPLREAIAVAQEPLWLDPSWDDEDFRCGDVCAT